MRQIIIFISLLLVFKNSYCQLDSAKSAREILKIEQRLADASPGDSATWSKYLDPKWHVVLEDGSGQFKREFLKGFYPFPTGVWGSIKVTKPVFSFHQNIAVVHYVADEYESFHGNKLHTTYGTADTWYKTDTSWMMLSMEDFEIPQLPPAIQITSKVLRAYTGTYILADNNVAVVSLENDTLFIQKNKKKKLMLFPETVNIFFTKSDTRGRKLFVEDENGTMLLLERRNGQDVVWRRN